MAKSKNKIKNRQYYAVSLERGLSVLRCFTPDRPIWNLTQISKAIGLNKISTYRYVNTLVELGYMKRDPYTKMLRLGPQILTFSLGYFQSTELREIARPLIDEASETYNINTEFAYLVPKTGHTLTRKKALKNELSLIRKRGYALNDEEWVQGLIAIAAPVMDHRTNKVIGAVCFDSSTIHHSITTIEKKYADVVVKLADNISRLIEVHGM